VDLLPCGAEHPGSVALTELEAHIERVKEVKSTLASPRGWGGPEKQAGSQADRKRDTPHGYPVGLSGSDSRHAGLWEAAEAHPQPRLSQVPTAFLSPWRPRRCL